MQFQRLNVFTKTANDTTNISKNFQLVVILRYTVENGKPVVKIWNFMNYQNCNAHILAEIIKQDLLDVLCENKYKLFLHSHDGVLVIRGQYGGFQTLLRKKYTCQHFEHCYAHQLVNMQLLKINWLELFASLAQFVSFFFYSSHRTLIAGSSTR